MKEKFIDLSASRARQAIFVAATLALLTVPARASVLFQIERVSDTQAIVTGTGSLNGPTPSDILSLIQFVNPFGIAPSPGDNKNIFQSATMQVGGKIVDAAYTCGSSINCDGSSNPDLYFATNGGLAIGDSVSSGNLVLDLASSGTSLAVVGTSGNVYWSVQVSPTLIGTWEMVSAAGATPLPAALPLFATGLGVLGLLGRRRKRKAAALAA